MRARDPRPANEGLCRRNNTCARMRYALTPAAAYFVRFAGLSCGGGTSYQSEGENATNAKFCVKFGNVQILLYLCSPK